MTDLPDAEAAWETWNALDTDAAGYWPTRNAFLAGFAAASVLWAEQLDTANAELEDLKLVAAKARKALKETRAERDAALARNAELEAEIVRHQQVAGELAADWFVLTDKARASVEDDLPTTPGSVINAKPLGRKKAFLLARTTEGHWQRLDIPTVERGPFREVRVLFDAADPERNNR